MVFVSGDIQYVKWRKFDQIHFFIAACFFASPAHAGLSERWGNFSVMALMLVLAASEHLGELILGGIGSGRR